MLADKLIIFTTVIAEPDDVNVCEGEEAVFTCELNSNIEDDDVQWYGFMKDTGTTKLMIPAGDNITLLTHTGNTINSSLIITNAIQSHTGYYWVRTPSLIVCNVSLTVVTSVLIHTITQRT